MTDFYVGKVLFDENGDLKLNAIYDCADSLGTTGQVLSSTGAALEWITPASAGVAGVTGTSPISVNNTDPTNPIISVNAGTATACGALIGVTQFGAGTCLNTALGGNAGCALDTGESNTLIGNIAGCQVTSGCVNIALGSFSGCGITTGCNNIAIGSFTLATGAGVTGLHNIAIGDNTARAITSGCFNIVMGCWSGICLNTGSSNIIIGCNSGTCLTTGAHNIAIGTCVLGRATGAATKFGNIGIGRFSGTCLCDSFNIAIGEFAGSTGFCGNTSVGTNAGANMGATACGAVFIGRASGPSGNALNLNYSNSVYIGAFAGYFTGGTGNTLIGGCVMYGSCTCCCGSNQNTVVGQCALRSARLTSQNTVIGTQSLQSHQCGSGNVTLGYLAGSSIICGSCNIVIGTTATTGSDTDCNLAIGLGVAKNWLTGNNTFAIKPGKGIIDCADSCGTATQVLASTGANAVVWASPAYGAFSDSTTQTNGDTTNGQAVTLDTVSSANDFSIVSNSRITAARTGVYNLQISLQVEKTDSGTDSVEIWFKKNGTNIANSNTTIQLEGNGAKQLFALNIVEPMTAGQYLEIWWYSVDADVQLVSAIAGTRPAIPSAIVTIVPVGALG